MKKLFAAYFLLGLTLSSTQFCFAGKTEEQDKQPVRKSIAPPKPNINYNNAKEDPNPTRTVREIIKDEAYAGEGRAASGESVYFSMELVNSSNIDYWQHFADLSYRFTDDSRGTISLLAKFCNSEKRRDLLNYERIKEFLGMSEPEYQEYKEKLIERKMYNPDMNKGLLAVGSGACAFQLSKEDNTYVVYASKKPITDKFLFSPHADEINTLKGFNEEYGDILIAVRLSLRENPAYYVNRGIFRNPASFVEGGYKGIAMKLHAFSGAVAEKFFPTRQYMVVHALPSMHTILTKEVPLDAGFLGNDGTMHPNAPENLRADIENEGKFSGVLDTPDMIKVEWLSKKYHEQFENDTHRE